MGWKSKVAGKVGHYLSQSIEFPLKQLHKYANPPSSSSSSSSLDPPDLSHPSNHSLGADDDEYGPDTSSLTAFLLSLLTNSSADHARSDSLGSLERNDSASTSGSWHRHYELSEDHQPNTNNDAHDSASSCMPTSECCSQSHPTMQPSPPVTPVRLPPSSDKSVLLSESFRAFLYSALPNIVKDRHWIMLYSTAKHGISLRTLYRRSTALSEPFLLVAGDFHGAVFGGLLTAPLKPTSKRKYLGTSDMFVFTNVNEKPQIFRATGANRYFLLCMNDAISLGGGGHFALHLDEDLLNGSSGPCDTFGNQCLATSSDFSVSNVELWGFAYVSKYR